MPGLTGPEVEALYERGTRLARRRSALTERPATERARPDAPARSDASLRLRRKEERPASRAASGILRAIERIRERIRDLPAESGRGRWRQAAPRSSSA